MLHLTKAIKLWQCIDHKMLSAQILADRYLNVNNNNLTQSFTKKTKALFNSHANLTLQHQKQYPLCTRKCFLALIYKVKAVENKHGGKSLKEC